jgi:hypothetical protein
MKRAPGAACRRAGQSHAGECHAWRARIGLFGRERIHLGVEIEPGSRWYATATQQGNAAPGIGIRQGQPRHQRFVRQFPPLPPPGRSASR